MIEFMDKTQITKDFAKHIIAISVAESGAMGDKGRVIVLTDQKAFIDYIYGKEIERTNIYDVFHEIRHKLDYSSKSGKKVTAGWKYTDLGAGNHLFMIEWLDTLFYKIVDKNSSRPHYIYGVWMETAMSILNSLSGKASFCKYRNDYRTNFPIIPVNAARKEVSYNDFIRESLTVNWDSELNKAEKVVAIGINPSTAQDGESDTTMTKFCRFLDMYGFNNVTMLNLFESVTPKQDKINRKLTTDFSKKTDLLNEADIILLVWGVGSNFQDKHNTIPVLAGYAEKLYCIKNTNGSYPAHPSRMSYQSEIVPVCLANDFEACGLKTRKNTNKI